jgi:hypothetical protein
VGNVKARFPLSLFRARHSSHIVHKGCALAHMV